MAETQIRTCSFVVGGGVLSQTAPTTLDGHHQGMSTEDVARELIIGVATVRTHLYRVCTKLGRHSQTAARLL